jgi:hypothetical protein
MSKVNLLELVLEADIEGIKRFLEEGGEVNESRPKRRSWCNGRHCRVGL